MDEKILKVVASISSMAIWSFVLFYFLGFGNLAWEAMQKAGGMGSIFILILFVAIWFLPVIIIKQLMPKPPKP